MRTIALLCLLAMLAGCSKLTVENYDKLKTGIEYGEVVKILGKPDSCSEVVFVKSCVWGDERKSISVSFMGDKAIMTTSNNIK